MSEYLVCIDPGHGGRQVGAVSKEFGYQEKVIALDISLKVRDLLLYSDLEGSKLVFREYCQEGNRKNIDVLLTRTTDEDVSLADRCKKANKAKASIFVSIHCNSCNSTSPSGIETWCFDSPKSESRPLAQSIQTCLMGEVSGYTLNKKPIKSRGVKATTAYYTIRHTSMPSVVVECGFMSNPDEVDLMYNNEVYRESLAKGIVKGILTFLNQS